MTLSVPPPCPLPGPAPPTAPARMVAALARHPLALIASGVVMYSTGPVMVAGSHVSGAVLSFWRLWIGTLVMGLATAIHVRLSGRRPARAGWVLASRCGVAFGLHQLFFMTALKRTSVIDVTLMQLLIPVIVGVLATVVFGERPGPAFRLWSLVSIAGAAVVVLAGSTGPQGDPVGLALAIVNVVFFSVYLVGSKQARPHIDTPAFLFASVTTAALIVSAYVLVSGADAADIGPRDLLIAAALAVLPGGLGHFVTTWQLHRVPANIPAIMQLGMPFLSGAMAWVFLGQPIGVVQIVGGGITLVGVVGALSSRSGLELDGADPSVVAAD